MGFKNIITDKWMDRWVDGGEGRCKSFILILRLKQDQNPSTSYKIY